MVETMLADAGSANAMAAPMIGAAAAGITGLALLCFVLWRQQVVLGELRGEVRREEASEAEPAMFGALYGQPEESLMSRAVRALRAQPLRFAIVAAGVMGSLGIVQMSRVAGRSELRRSESAVLRAENDSLRALLAARAVAPQPAVASTPAPPLPSAITPAPKPSFAAARPPVRAPRTVSSPVPSAAILPPPPGLDAGAILPPPPPAPIAVPRR